MSSKKPTISEFSPPHVSMRTYVNGFIACIALTLLAYTAATSAALSNNVAIGIVAVLAVVQCVVQLRGFLHLGHEFKPRWKLGVFVIMLSIVLILVIGSLWIMNNLNYRMMSSPSQENEYVQGQDGL